MKLSDNTVSVLKNYSTINQNLMINAGSTLTTMSAMKNIVARATVAETFEKDVAIYDLNEFLASLSLFESPDLDFQDKFVMMGNEGSRKSLKYWYSDPSVVTTVTREITMPNVKCHSNFRIKNYLTLPRQLLLLVCQIWYWKMEVFESLTRRTTQPITLLWKLIMLMLLKQITSFGSKLRI